MEINKKRRYLLAALLIISVAPGFAAGVDTNSRVKPLDEKQINKTLWHLVEELIKRVPFTKSSLEELLRIPFMETRKTIHTIFYEGQPVGLSDGAVLEKIDLRIGLDEGAPGFLVLDLSGTCFTLTDVQSNFNATKIAQIPSGHSVEEATVHTTMQSRSTLSFGFREKNPNCLAYIAFDPHKK
ncbi:hypothetical protein RY831_13965 [Noviherbaspirillum sp. CPCC 100848]|uniref:Uncharacterized protein n=1 Tax=Noviherbaspirillum album TaxID=3080276 RepID=A0ABU6J9C8_9BURK|nr:hypothetical protein [Noviherbaspirillum sp. CPCC 100848]MEC4720262.1 hypothetical protein [Noviherbaspirillum sp. CPCC 100848]